MNMKYFLLFILASTQYYVNAQTATDSVMLLDGKTFRGNIIEISENFVTLNSYSSAGKDQGVINVDKYRVFSYHKGGSETVLYQQSDAPENFLSIDQTRSAALGSYDAINHYETKAVFYSSVAITFGFCIFDTYLTKSRRDKIGNPELKAGFFGRSPSIWPIASVLVLPISFAIPSTKVRAKNLVNGVRGDNYYYSGFNTTARQRRSFSALKGSAAGLVLGFGSYFIFHPNPF